MKNDLDSALKQRLRVHAALSDSARLRIVDRLALEDVSSSELGRELGLTSNLMAHHVSVLKQAGLVAGRRSQGDGRRQYLRLKESAQRFAHPILEQPTRLVFICTANSARSQLAAALWRESSAVPAESAGTHPAETIDPGAVEVAGRRGLDLPLVAPRDLHGLIREKDLVVSVCDLVHEEVAAPQRLHWSVPDPVREGTPEAFDAAYDEISERVTALAARLAS